MPTTIQGLVKIRKGTSAALASVVLLDGELGFATDTGALKIGDGITTFSSLPTGLDTRYYTKAETYSKTEINGGTGGTPASTSQYGVVKRTTTIGSTTTDTNIYYSKSTIDSATDQLLQNILNSYPGTIGAKSIVNPISGNTITKIA